jgi:hypothetical protein
MGRWNGTSKTVVEDCLKLSIFKMRQMGYFAKYFALDITWVTDGIRSFVAANLESVGDELQLRLVYSQTDQSTGQKQNFNYTIDLTTTPCNFGEIRYWFLCPLNKNGIKCNRRVGVL